MDYQPIPVRINAEERGKLIRSKREELGMSLAEVAEKLDLQKTTLSAWERGKVENIKDSDLEKLADVLGIRISLLTTGYYLPYVNDDNKDHMLAKLGLRFLEYLMRNIDQYETEAAAGKEIEEDVYQRFVWAFQDCYTDFMKYGRIAPNPEKQMAFLQALKESEKIKYTGK